MPSHTGLRLLPLGVHVVTFESRTEPTRWKIQESFSIETKPSWATREVSLRLWSKGSFSPGLDDFSEQASEKERDKTLNSSIYIPAVGLNYSAILSLFFSSPLWHFTSPHLTLTAQTLCAVCSEACCILHGYNGDGGGGKKKRRDLRLSLRTLISQSSWLHKSFLMYDTGDNRERHLLFTVQHQGSSGVGSPPAPLLLTCVILTRRAGRRAMIKHWLQIKRTTGPSVTSWRENTTAWRNKIPGATFKSAPAALGSPLLVPFSGWLGWGLHQNPTGAAGTNPICCQNPLFIYMLDGVYLLETTLTKGATKRSEREKY